MTQLERLAKPFPAKYVKPPAKGKYGNYIDHEIINQALLIILGPFSFEVQQVFYNPEGLLDGCTASLSAVIDGREVTVTEAGDCEHAEQKKTQGDRLKNAASDALKRCAMRLGCGLHVWAGDADFFLYEQLRQQNAEGAKGLAGSSVPTQPSEVDSGRAASASREAVPSATSIQNAEAKSEVRADQGASAPRPPAASANSSGTGSSHPPGESVPGVSKARREKLKSRCVALQADGVSVADEREKYGLPLVDSCNADQMTIFETLVSDLEAGLAAPFVEVTA